MRLAAYVRVSSDKQDVTRQRENITAWTTRNGAAPIWYEDSDGKNPRHRSDKRQSFQDLLKAVKAGRFERIIVDSQDRFGTKDAFEWGKLISILRDNDCELIDSQGRLLSGDDDGSVLSGVVGALTSKREQREKAHRNISGKVTYARKGEYQGGYAPYGTDVVCFGPDGKEKWRTVYVGHLDRLKVYPDGKSERFTGKNVTPVKDTTDTLRLRPTKEKDRLKIVRQVFKWYETEDISPRGIADRLNELQVVPIFGEAWYKHTIRAMLSNPIYIGLPTWNKRSNAAFVEYVNGRLQEINGKARTKRRESADFVQPEAPEFAPIVPVETFNKCQKKLQAASTTANRGHRSPKLAELWLRPFLYCGHCGEVMHAAGGGGTSRLKPNYFCSTYNKYGPKNPKGCHCHRVRHEVLEDLVLRYLKETTPKVAQLIQASDTGDVEGVRSILVNGRFLEKEYADVACDVIAYVEKFATAKERKRIGEGFDVVFGLAFERIRPKLEKAIAEKEAELDTMLDDYRTLPDRLKARAVAKMEPLEAEISELRQRLIDLRKPFQGIREELETRKTALETAEREIEREAAGRRKGEALRGVVDRIVCYFQHGERKVNNGRSRLDRVEIIPISGDSVSFIGGASQGLS